MVEVIVEKIIAVLSDSEFGKRLVWRRVDLSGQLSRRKSLVPHDTKSPDQRLRTLVDVYLDGYLIFVTLVVIDDCGGDFYFREAVGAINVFHAANVRTEKALVVAPVCKHAARRLHLHAFAQIFSSEVAVASDI